MKKLTTMVFGALVVVGLSMPAWAQATTAPNTQTKTTSTKQTKEEKKQAAKEKKQAAKTKKQASKDSKKNTTTK